MLRQMTTHMAKDKISSLSHTICKMKFRWIKELDVKIKKRKKYVKKLWANICDLQILKGFLKD